MWSCYGSAKQAAFAAKFGLTTHSNIEAFNIAPRSLKSCTPSLDKFQNLLHCFLAENDILVIHYHAWHTHDLVTIL